MHSLIEKLYFNSPILLQNIMISMYGYKIYRERYIGNHDQYLNQLLQSQWYSQTEIDQLVEERFNNIFLHAIETVPYYRDLVRMGKISPAEIKGTADIYKLPILTKEEIRKTPERFISDKFKRKELIEINTSGTTGKTLTIFVDKDSRRNAYACFSRLKSWAGIDISKKNVTFAGRTIVPPDSEKPPFWRKNMMLNNYLFSSYHLTSHNLKYYVEALKRIDPQLIDSYPSSIYVIAKYMKANGLAGIYPEAIITSSETLFKYQRETIEEILKCPIYDQYGSAEQVVFVSQCEKGTYHNHPEFGFVEFIKEDGGYAVQGEQARLICTGFTNRAMPLIRYDIGDTGIFSDEKCSCGRNFPVLKKIIGRTDDMLLMRDGRKVGRLDPVFKGLQSIKEAQIIQEDYDNITLKIVPGQKFKFDDAQIIVLELKKRLGTKIDINVQVVTHIERTSSGKFRAVISKIRKQ